MNENLLSTCELLLVRLLRACVSTKWNRRVFLLDCIPTMGLALFALSAPTVAGTVEKDLPNTIDANARYLFYMHGVSIEQGKRRSRSYDYSGILRELAKRGFVAIGEERKRVRNDVYATKVAGQVRKLLAAGIPARRITVAGHSKGGMITMLVMSRLTNSEIAYVNFAGCGREGSGFEGYLLVPQHRALMARGKLLSVYDRSDRIAGSCKPLLDKMSNALVTERVLNTGGGHGLFHTPKAVWLDILQAWAERRQE